jgi:hypothetical protein
MSYAGQYSHEDPYPYFAASSIAAVDRKARALNMSRNRLVIRALERELAAGADWSPRFFEKLSVIDSETATAVNELFATLRP